MDSDSTEVLFALSFKWVNIFGFVKLVFMIYEGLG